MARRNILTKENELKLYATYCTNKYYINEIAEMFGIKYSTCKSIIFRYKGKE